MIVGIVIGALVFVTAWLVIFISLWVSGIRNRDETKVLIGAVCTLGFIGYLIAKNTTSSWYNESSSSERLELEKERLELEKQRLELEKMKSEK